MVASRSIVWLASYPKSGNTWLRAMLTALVQPEHKLIDLNSMIGGSELGERQFLDDICGIDSSSLPYDQLKPYLRAMRQAAGGFYQAPYFAKTHERFGLAADGQALFPAESAKLAVLIVRHPFDVAVSLAAHNQTDIDAAVCCMADPDYGLNVAAHEGSEFLPVQIGDWSSHAESWLDQDEIPLLLVRYEDMVTDPMKILRAVAEASEIAAGEAELGAAVDAASFEQLREKEQASGFAEKPAGMPAFFRSGRAGGGKDELSADQKMTLETLHSAVMQRLGYAH